MAKSKGFFSLRRGSTKSLTYSVYNGQQVTKERIAYMTNPQTYDQGSTRALFAAAAKFYSRMKMVLDHSFEGIKYGTPSQSEFMRLAIKSGIGSSLEKGASAYPLNYPISRGTLPSIAWLGLPHIAQTSVAAKFASRLQISAFTESVSTFADNNNLEHGDQISFVYAEIVNGEMHPILLRMVIDTNVDIVGNLNAQRVYTGGKVQNTTPTQVFSIVGGYLSVNADMLLGVVANATWVLSRYDGAKWLRSDSDFTLLDEENAGAGIPSYTKQTSAGTSVEDSSKFLNEGETKYGVVRKLVSKTITIDETEKTVYANIDVACKFVKNADGSVTRYLLSDPNDMVMGEVGSGAYGFVLAGALVEGAPEGSLLIGVGDVQTAAGDEWGTEPIELADFRNAIAFQYVTA
ncbi:MAG: hypothetical protein IKG25_04665 [Mogibacterium sp.]|nr:hypothetical protein [Clostridia bacterium]MBQ5889340.1 hypothetical protein [Clostridia bacterium]MBR3330492.1 hypothetical protein [Mogibacterium sp.]